jgi:outer membrane protein TolC
VVIVVAVTAGNLAAEPAPPPLKISIEDAMRAAERASLPLVAARETTARAESEIDVARSTYFPQLFGSASYVRTISSEYRDLFNTSDATGSPFGNVSGSPFGPKHTWRVGLDASQLVWDGGRTRSNVSRARTSRTLAHLDEQGTRAEAVLQVTEAYYGAALGARLVAIGEQSLALAEQTFAQARLGYEQGTTSEFDMVRAEVTRDNQRTSVVRARADAEIAMVRLRQLLGLPLDRPLELTTTLSDRDITTEASRIAQIAPNTTRLPVAQAEANLALRRAQTGVSRAERWPQISLFSSLGEVDYPSRFLPDDNWRRNWTVGVTASVPLFTGFRITAQLRADRADERAAAALVTQAAQLAAVDERQSRTDIAVAAATLQASTRSAELARRAYQIAEVRYRQGVSTYLELSDARLALDQAQINEASATRDLQVSRVRVALLPALPLAGAPVPSATSTIDATAAANAARAATGQQAAGQTTTGTTTPGTVPQIGQPTGTPQPGR